MKWISVKDEMPKEKGNYICCFDTGKEKIVDVFDYDPAIDTQDYWGYAFSDRVIYWMPLPEPPDED